jgi:hypothetical protein
VGPVWREANRHNIGEPRYVPKVHTLYNDGQMRVLRLMGANVIGQNSSLQFFPYESGLADLHDTYFAPGPCGMGERRWVLGRTGLPLRNTWHSTRSQAPRSSGRL